MNKIEYNAWYIDGGCVLTSVRTYSKRHMLECIVNYRGAFATFEDFRVTSLPMWRAKENEEEIDLAKMITAENYGELTYGPKKL